MVLFHLSVLVTGVGFLFIAKMWNKSFTSFLLLLVVVVSDLYHLLLGLVFGVFH